MAVEVESLVVAWCAVGGEAVAAPPPATLVWEGQGFDSVVRNGIGDYTFVLTEAMDPNDLISFHPVSNVLGTQFPTRQVEILSPTQIRVNTFHIGGIAAFEQFNMTIQVVRFSVEASRAGVV